MANEILISENKTLKLSNVLSRELNIQDGSDFGRTAAMFRSYTSAKNLNPYGPMVVRIEPRTNGKGIVIVSTMMGQVRNVPDEVETPFSFTPQIRAERCLMARFAGPPSKLQLAYNKLDVYSYEKDIPLSGVTYTVYTGESPNGDITADIFAEVLE